MSDMEELIVQEGSSSLRNLKKIVAGKGKIQGNFYFAGDSRGKNAGVVISLTTRDPKGMQAMGGGKKLRKAIPGAKFARGIVTCVEGKLWFSPKAGNASAGQVKMGFKKAFAAPELKILKAFLRKSLVGDPAETDTTEQDEEIRFAEEEALQTGETSAEEIDEANTSAEALIAHMTAEERKDFEKLNAESAQLAQANESLENHFLSASDARIEAEQAIQQTMKELANMAQTDPSAIQAKRFALAEQMYTGPDPFPEPGGSLNAQAQEVLRASLGVAMSAIEERLQVSVDILVSRRDHMKDLPEDERPAFSQHAVAELAPHMHALDSLMDQANSLNS